METYRVSKMIFRCVWILYIDQFVVNFKKFFGKTKFNAMNLWIYLILVLKKFKYPIFISFDYLILYNGDSSASPLIGKYCGDLLPPDFISSTNSAFIHFHTDNINEGYIYHVWQYLDFSFSFQSRKLLWKQKIFID